MHAISPDSNTANPFALPPDDLDIVQRIIHPARPQLKRGMHVNEGYRFICLGETGSGKTSLMRLVMYHTLAIGWANYALIHDTKNVWPEYPKSLQFPTVDSFLARGGFRDGDIPVVSFRGDPRSDLVATAESVAAYSKKNGQFGRQDANGVWVPDSHIVVIEELAEAASEGRKKLDSPAALWLLEQGRKVGISLIGTTQSPRNVPLDIYEQASAIAFFRLTLGGNYLGERLKLDPRLIATIVGPNNEGLPDFQYCLYVKGQPWDEKIHCLDKRSALMFE
jgi:hypothetical protein